jgi:hypothetical protein
MHSTTFVLLEPPFENLLERAEALLEPHRLDEDNYREGWKTDYWSLGDESIRDDDTARAIGIVDDEDLEKNVCFVHKLARDVRVACIVTPDGTWHDVADHGWRGYEVNAANLAALENWRAEFRALFEKWAHCVAVEFDTHS